MNDITPAQPAPAPPATFGGALRSQRRALLLAAGLVVASIWISVPLGKWQGGLFLAAGIALGALNHVLTDFALQKAISSGDEITRQAYASSSLLRLALISVLAFAVAWAFWPYGAAVFFGLALFHLIALVLTGIPLLREVRKQ
jgi:hypothetical protein